MQYPGEAEQGGDEHHQTDQRHGSAGAGRLGEQGAHRVRALAGQVEPDDQPLAEGTVAAGPRGGRHDDQQRYQAGECLSGDDQAAVGPFDAQEAAHAAPRQGTDAPPDPAFQTIAHRPSPVHPGGVTTVRAPARRHRVMKTLPTAFDVTFLGHLDAALLDLVTEYGLAGLPAQITLRGLHADPATLQAIFDRAYVIGITVAQLRPADRD